MNTQLGTRVSGAVLRRLLLALSAALAASIAFAVPVASATTSHSLAGSFGGPGLADGLFSGLGGIGVFGASGELFVADVRNGEAPYGRVQRFDGSGGFVSAFAFADEPVAAYQGVSALAVDPSGSGAVYVLGRLSGAPQENVLKFSPDGTFEYLLDQAGSGTTFNVDGGEALAVDAVDGTVYVSAKDAGEAPVIDRFDGSTGAFINSINGSSSPEGGFFCQLTGLAVDSSHNVYVLDPCKGPYGTGQVDEFAADGTFGAVVDDGSRGAPKAVAVDPVSDEVYVAQEAAVQPGQVFGLLTPHVTQYAAGGGAAVSTFDLGSTFGVGAGMAVNGTGTVYLANSATAQVARFAKFNGPTVVSGATTVQSAREVTVEGTIDPEGVTSTYHFEYGNGSSYDTKTVEAAAGAGSGAVAVSATLKGLKPNQTYHYRIVGTNPSGSIDGADQTFTTAQAPASVDSPEFASAIGPRSARLHSAVNPNSSALAEPEFGFGHTLYHFEYGTTGSYGTTAVGSDGGTICITFTPCGGDYVSVAASLSGLLPDTTYHFRVVGDNGVGSPQEGADQTFITAPAAGGGASSATSTNAMLTGTINPHGVPTSYHFNYGQTSSYGTSTADVDAGSGEGDQQASLPVSGLLADTTYHVQVVAESEDGATRYGADGLFRTAPAPDAVAFGALGVSSGSATLTGELNTFGLPGSYHFDISSPDGAYRTSTPERQAAGNANPQHLSVPIEGLPPGQTILVRLVVSSNDSTTLSNQVTFATPVLPPVFPVPPTDDPGAGCAAPALDAYNAQPRPGETVRITGHDLGAAGNVVLGDRPIVPAGWSPSGFDLPVPNDAAGTLALTINCGHRSNTIAIAIFHEPDNSFSITRAAVRGSTATVSVRVPGPGKLETSAAHTKAGKTTVGKAGPATVHLGLTSTDATALKKAKSRSLKVRVKVRFTPTGGKPASKTVIVTFKGKAGR